ncbi:hypothetical protein Cgig2_033670 [Carnegiea gigantea]|uniref:DC1 domain-containing protein n=1 Tax=Carnegiea gigantea TaxID=171969 RepID=A0A9Q1JFF7_9CARY|nr:hypothetical protein Cgig2_033670 [Carnegiea gigantea]
MICCSQQPNELQKLKLKLHEHKLVKTWRDPFCCDGCHEPGSGWSFYCNKCSFGLHPECALKNHKKDDMPSWIPKRIMTCCSQQPKDPTKEVVVVLPMAILMLALRLCGENYEKGCHWSFRCKACNFDLHPKCALKNTEKAELGEGSKVKATDEEGKAKAKDDESKTDAKEDSICEGDVSECLHMWD